MSPTCPELDPHYAKDEEDKEAEEEDIAQHGQGVQQQHHQDPHAWVVGEELFFCFVFFVKINAKKTINLKKNALCTF